MTLINIETVKLNDFLSWSPDMTSQKLLMKNITTSPTKKKNPISDQSSSLNKSKMAAWPGQPGQENSTRKNVDASNPVKNVLPPSRLESFFFTVS